MSNLDRLEEEIRFGEYDKQLKKRDEGIEGGECEAEFRRN